MRHAAAGLFFVAVLGCAPSAQAADAPDFKATAHTIAIVSVLGDEIDTYGGTTPIADAGFDALAERAMADQIAADLPGASVRSVGVPRDVLHAQMYPKAGFGDAGMDKSRAYLLPWGAAHPVDYIVIFRKTVGNPDTNEFGTPFCFGISLDCWGTTAFLNVTVCDGKTLKVVAALSVRDLSWGSIRYERGDPTPEHLPILTNDIRAMLASVVPGLVHGVGL